MRALQKELDDLRETRMREQERETRRARDDQQELQALRERYERLEEEHANIQRVRTAGLWSFVGSHPFQADPEVVDQLRSDMQGLLTEVSDLSRRNDEIMQARDQDLVVIQDLNAQIKEYKRKYELAKTELRNVKGAFVLPSTLPLPSRHFLVTSQLFLQTPKLDDQLPVALDGGVADIHVTAFLSAIDSLLTAARSSSPVRVLTPMKAVVNAVTAIVEDIRAYEARGDPDADPNALLALRERAEATLGNLVAASRTHAMSVGMSPVSLVDAAASHVAATVTEAGRMLCIRKATKAEQEHFAAASSGGFGTGTPSSSVTMNGFVPALRTVDEAANGSSSSPTTHTRNMSSSSTRRPEYFSPPGSLQQQQQPSPLNIRKYGEPKQTAPSELSSSDASSPPPLFDMPLPPSMGGGSDDSPVADGPEDAWAELKVRF